MSLIDKKLAELKLSQEVVDIYRDELSDDELTGLVVALNKDFVVLNLLTEDGEDNGISVLIIDSITRVRNGGNLRKSIKDLSNFRSNRLKSPKINLSSIKDILVSVQSNYGYVNLHTEEIDDEICFIGKVKEQDLDWVSLLAYGTMSSRDTYDLMLRKDEITRIDAGGKYEESIKYLMTDAPNNLIQIT